MRTDCKVVHFASDRLPRSRRLAGFWISLAPLLRPDAFCGASGLIVFGFKMSFPRANFAYQMPLAWNLLSF
jgi:hypothetical protein